MIRSLLIAAALLAIRPGTATAQAARPAPTAKPKAGALLPPAAVKAAFAKRFPAATAVAWEKEDANYEAEFRAGKVATSAVFTARGEFKEVERAALPTALPAPVLPYLQQHYAGQKIKEVARIEDASGTVTWETEISGKDLIFNAAGKFLREQIEPEDDKGSE